MLAVMAAPAVSVEPVASVLRTTMRKMETAATVDVAVMEAQGAVGPAGAVAPQSVFGGSEARRSSVTMSMMTRFLQAGAAVHPAAMTAPQVGALST